MGTNKRYHKLKRFLIVLSILVISFFAYVAIVNRNSKNMNNRQKFLKAVYPVFMWWTKLTGKNSKELSGTKEAPVSFYLQKATLINGDTLDFATLKGKKILLVNTASECGYTNQYDDLQKLSQDYKD